MKTKIIILFILLYYSYGYSCTMYKITMHGKTFVGNNEDWSDPNTRMWFEHGKTNEYGAMFFGFQDLYPQGGMNEKGLVFDGFFIDPRPIRKKANKLPFYPNIMPDVIKKCQDVDEAYEMLNKYDLSPVGGMLMFVDKKGNYLVVEPDTLIKGNDDKYLLSNFCPSKTPDLNSVNLPYYQKGRKMFEAKADTSLNYLKSLSDSLHQSWPNNTGGTLYTTIYDLNEGTVNLYFYHDYSYSVKFNLKDELKKNTSIISIPHMFPYSAAGQEHFKNFTRVDTLFQLIREKDLANNSIELTKYIDVQGYEMLLPFFEPKINSAGYYLLKENKIGSAINVFKLNAKYSPTSWNCYDSLGDGYMKAKQYDKALASYKKSLEYNPNNEHGLQQIKEINKLMTQHKKQK